MKNNSNIKSKHSTTFRMSVILTSAVVLFFISMFSIMIGSSEFSFTEIFSVLKGSINGTLANKVIMNLRVPRVLTGIFVGMNLGVAGSLLQGILRNPMASPNIIGVNAGAGLGAVIVMTVLPQFSTAVPIFAFSGALGATLLIYALSAANRSINNTVYIILAGVAVSNLLNAVTSGLMMINSDTLEVTYSWLQGSLSGRTWPSVKMILPYSIVGLCTAVIISPKVNLFGLGDELASSMGLSVKFYRVFIMVIASILAGSAVSVTGTIGFVGLIAPHTARILIGNDHKFLIPLSALLGAILLVLSDTVARTVFLPTELSVGIITSVLGAPFFLWLLYNKRKKK